MVEERPWGMVLSWQASAANGTANHFSHTTLRHYVVEIHTRAFKVVVF